MQEIRTSVNGFQDTETVNKDKQLSELNAFFGRYFSKPEPHDYSLSKYQVLRICNEYRLTLDEFYSELEKYCQGKIDITEG